MSTTVTEGTGILNGKTEGEAPAAPQTAVDAMYGSPGDALPGAGAVDGGAPPVAPDPAAPAGEEKTEPTGFDPAAVVMPEGVEVDTKGMELIAPIFKELNLGQEQGQKVIDAYIKLEQGKLEAELAKQQEWQAAIKADREFGGDKFEVNATKANQLLERFGDDQLFEYLASSGAGNNPAVFRFVARIAAVMGEDRPVTTTTAGAPTKDDVLSVLYPEKKG